MADSEFKASMREAREDEEREGDEATGKEARGEEAPANAVSETSDEAMSRLKLDLQRTLDESEKFRNELLRAKADLDNYQKLVRRERPNWEAHAVRHFVRDLLPTLDNFERAMSTSLAEGGEAATITEGIRLIYQMLKKTLEDHGVVEIAALGEPFDPEFHEAVAEVEVSEGETGRIVDVQQKGYVHKGVVVRPSQVVVARRVNHQ
jgi:molecular chaperone GrpE